MQIKEEFKKLIPALSMEEFNQLEENILKEGIRDAILTWNGFIIDGHNRYEIAQKHNLKFKTEEKVFENELDVKIWMAKNQLGRRNLTDFVKGELLKIIEELTREKGDKKYKETVGRPSKEKSLSTIDNDLPKHNTQKQIADQLGWSTGKKAMFDVVVKKAPEPVKEKLRTGEVSINQAYQEIKKEEKEQLKTKKVEEIKESTYKPDENIYHGSCLDYIHTIKDKSIDCLITDPPYGVDFQLNKYDNKMSRKIENDTDAAFLLVDDALRILKPKLKPDAHLYIFCSWKVYPEFKDIIAKYYEIKNVIIWNKKLMGMGDLKFNYGDVYEMIIFAGGQREFLKRPQNVIDCRFEDERFHNTQKPVKLLKELILNSTEIGQHIFDPFLGSGSTALAAKETKRNFSGCEIDEQNYKITLKRLQHADI